MKQAGICRPVSLEAMARTLAQDQFETDIDHLGGAIVTILFLVWRFVALKLRQQFLRHAQTDFRRMRLYRGQRGDANL
ncbi:hypothetical protein ABTK05_20395, partial [Acinetobacter baumannii]